MQRSLEIAGTFGAVHRSHAAWFDQSFRPPDLRGRWLDTNQDFGEPDQGVR